MNANNETTDDATRILAEEFLSVSFDDHPDSVHRLARRAVIDALGNAFLAWETPLGQSYVTSTLAMHGQTCGDTSGGVPLLGHDGEGSRVTPIDAAFVNAGLINALDWDDTIEGGGHPGASIIPTALAIAGGIDATMNALLNAIIVRYEVSTRVTKAFQPSRERYELVHGSGTRHTIGAVAAASALLKHETTATQELLGRGAQLAPVPHAAKFGWAEERLTWLKDNVAQAAAAATRAANFQSGFTGPRRVLDDDDGFWQMIGSDQCDWVALTRPLGEPYGIKSLSFKPYPCCRWLHCAEATYNVMRAVDRVESVHVETADRVASNFMLEPINQVNAEFSLPFVVRMAAVTAEPYTWYSAAGLRTAPDLTVTASGSVERSEQFAEQRTVPATVIVTDVSGATVTETVFDPHGSISRPLAPPVSIEKLTRGIERRFDDIGEPDSQAEAAELVTAIETQLQADCPVSEFIELITQPTIE